MSKLKSVISFNGTVATVIEGVDPAPNVCCFACQVNLAAFTGGDTSKATCMLVKMSLTKDGTNCQAELVSARDFLGISDQVFETMVKLI